jgi:hypothetical protein
MERFQSITPMLRVGLLKKMRRSRTGNKTAPTLDKPSSALFYRMIGIFGRTSYEFAFLDGKETGTRTKSGPR